MRNAGLEETQAEIKIAGRNINCFLRIVLFSSHGFRVRNKEEENLTPISLVISHLP